MNNLFATYAGIVERVDDPEKLGRVKVRVPHVYGITGSGTGYVGTNQLPWALPCGLPAGGKPASGGFSMLPEPGDHVWVRFLDGEPEKPIWEWGMQTQDDAKGLRLHSYDRRDGVVGKPDATRWTRYGHLVEMIDGAVTVATSKGYNVFLLDADDLEQNGHVKVSTPKGNYLSIDDLDDSATLSVNADLYLNVLDEISASCRTCSLSAAEDVVADIGGKFDVTVTNNIELKTALDMSVDVLGNASTTVAGSVLLSAQADMALEFEALQLGQDATEPFVLGTQLSTFLSTLLVWLDTHTHSNGNLGSPTGPPIVPTAGAVQPQVELLTSKVIVGK